MSLGIVLIEVNGTHAPNADRIKSVPSLATFADEAPIRRRYSLHHETGLTLRCNVVPCHEGVGPDGVRCRRADAAAITVGLPQIAADFAAMPESAGAGARIGQLRASRRRTVDIETCDPAAAFDETFGERSEGTIPHSDESDWRRGR